MTKWITTIIASLIALTALAGCTEADADVAAQVQA